MELQPEASRCPDHVAVDGTGFGSMMSSISSMLLSIQNKRYTLVVRPIEDGDTASSVLAEFLGVLDGLDTEVNAVYLDRGFYDSKCPTLLQVHNYAYVVLTTQWGKAIQQELSEGWSRVIQYDLTGKLEGHNWTVEFPVYIGCTYINGRYDENNVPCHGYGGDAPFIETPGQAQDHYSKHFGIESSYRLSEQAIAATTTRDATVRLLYVVMSSAATERVAVSPLRTRGAPCRGGRRLWWWPYKEFVNITAIRE